MIKLKKIFILKNKKKTIKKLKIKLDKKKINTSLSGRVQHENQEEEEK
jgi:hypothetical protein